MYEDFFDWWKQVYREFDGVSEFQAHCIWNAAIGNLASKLSENSETEE